MAESQGKTSTFTVALSREDFVAYNLLGTGFTFVWFALYIAIVVGVLSASGFYDNLTAGGFLRYIWLPAGLMVVLCCGYFGYIHWQARRFFEKNPEITAEVTYQLQKKGLNIKRGKEQKTVPWGSFYRVWANRRVVAFFTSKANAYIIPASVLRECGLLPELTALLKEQVPKRRLRLPRSLQS